MSKSKKRPPRPVTGATGQRSRLLLIVGLLIILAGGGTLAHWAGAFVPAASAPANRVAQDESVTTASYNANSPAKEYIYAGGRLVATEEPSSGGGNPIGTWTIGVYRPSNQTFYLKDANTIGPANTEVPYGGVGDIPLVGDWDRQ